MTEGSMRRELLTQFRVIAESSFYMNNIEKVNSIEEAYGLALINPGTIVVDQKIFQPEEVGFPKDARTLVFNDGAVIGRMAGARRILGEEGIEPAFYNQLLREAVYGLSLKEKNYYAQCVIGLHEDFMVRAHLLVPKSFENTVLSWLCNFQEINKKYREMYGRSTPFKENDVYIVADPDWSHKDFPYGLTFFSPEENVAFILGMRYFGEFKKATLTLAWGIADRNGYASCHGGLKSYDDLNFVAAFFGLSGSGKSTLTHAKHGGKYNITILHDDAFIINDKTYQSIALEPSYFDKTADYKVGAEDNRYILTAQNVGVGLNDKGEKILITEDIRNGNGRAVKSRLWSPNRVDKMEKEINAIFWLMKDPSIPPVLKINDPALGAAMGATLATKRTSAERLAKGVDPHALVFEPFANPFRTYPLKDDYLKFKSLFERGVDCYILNTGHFMDTKVKPQDTLSIIEHVAEKRDPGFKKLFSIANVEFATGDIRVPDEGIWKRDLIVQLEKRVAYIDNLSDRNSLPGDAKEAIALAVSELNK